MYRINKEKIKSYILIVLILSAIIQLGIIWDYENQVFPINFLVSVFTNHNSIASNSENFIREELFKPVKIVVSDGEDTYWQIRREDDIYDMLWEDNVKYLKDILKLKPVKVLSHTEIKELIQKKAFTISFGTKIDMNLVEWFMDFYNTETHLSGIYQIIISPWDDINMNMNTIYISDGTNIYKYIIPFGVHRMNIGTYQEIIKQLRNNSKYDKDEYSVLGEYIPNAVNPGILCVVLRKLGYREYAPITLSPPESISDPLEMAVIILGNDKKSYHRSIDIYNTVVFKNMNNLYRVYGDGYLRYDYIGGTLNEREDILEAFLRALEFIIPIYRQLNINADIYLSGIKKANNGTYEFTFDYIINNIPVVINYPHNNYKSEILKNAIIINAGTKRVLKCNWLIKNFKVNKYTAVYDVYFDNIASMAPELKPQDFREALDIYSAYVITGDKTGDISPSWIMVNSSGNKINIPMKLKRVAD